jgi:hypothetical protein
VLVVVVDVWRMLSGGSGGSNGARIMAVVVTI